MKTSSLALLITCIALPFASLATVASAKSSTTFGALAGQMKSLKRTTNPLLHLTVDRELQTSACGGDDCCTPCAKGLKPTSPDSTINLGGFAPEVVTTMTCSEGLALVETFPANDDSCPTLQMVGFAFCGCPEPPVMANAAGVCTLCSDGAPVPDPEVLVDLGDGESLSCGIAQLGLGLLNDSTDTASGNEASAALSTMEQQVVVTEPDDYSYDTGIQNIDTCSLMQNSIGSMCGCAKSTSNTADGCKICGSNRILTNPNHVVDDQEGLTCGSGAQQASIVPGDDTFCEYIQAEAIAAGCKCTDDETPKSNLSDTGTPFTGTPSDITREDGEEDGITASSSAFLSFDLPIFATTIAIALLL